MPVVMCFSAEADLIAGVVVTVLGADALFHLRHRRELLLGLLPVMFGLHQLVEAVVWWGLDGTVGESALSAATWIYLMFAFGVLPWFVALAVAAMEPMRLRRMLMVGLGGAGAVVAAALAIGTLQGTPIAQDAGSYVRYSTGISHGGELAVAYVAVTCVPLLLSSYRNVVIFGIVNLMAVTTLAALLMGGVISLWCGWAAVTSIVIALHLRQVEQPNTRGVWVRSEPRPAR
jgi:hypothetical protein